jgi:hypothetical protein
MPGRLPWLVAADRSIALTATRSPPTSVSTRFITEKTEDKYPPKEI